MQAAVFSSRDYLTKQKILYLNAKQRLPFTKYYFFGANFAHAQNGFAMKEKIR
jgi:hypothetical protein